MNGIVRRLFISITLLSLLPTYLGQDATYKTIKKLEDSMFSKTNYSTTLRPLETQTEIQYVSVSLSLVAIAAVDDVKQEIITNAFLFIIWENEVATWDSADYGGFAGFTPSPKDYWKPRLMLINTYDERDPFEDDYTHTFFSGSGTNGWVPGGLFKTYCDLNLKKFPFDSQECVIQMCPMGHTKTTLVFQADPNVNLAFYYPNPGWELINVSVAIRDIAVVGTEVFSCPTFTLKIKRRPTLIVLNVILPVLFLSLLNNFVFFIPVDSGEKIGYAITVLLSLSVFLSMVSSMTPQVSNVVPALTVYLFVLFLSSVLTSGAVLFTSFLHNLDEREETTIKTEENFRHAMDKLKMAKAAVTPLQDIVEKQAKTSLKTQKSVERSLSKTPRRNKYRIISIHVDKLCFLFMWLTWFIITIWFFVVTHS